MTTDPRYDIWSRQSTDRQSHGDRNVNNIRHTVCKFRPDANPMDFKLQRRRPDSYDVPASSQRLLKLDDCLISRRLRARLCSASRVYCGNNILNLHRNHYSKPRPSSVQYRWSPPEISLALPKIQRTKTAGLVRLNPTAYQTSSNSKPVDKESKPEYVKHEQKKKKKKPDAIKIPQEKERGDGDKESIALKTAADDNDDTEEKDESKAVADDNSLLADDYKIEAAETKSTEKDDMVSRPEKEPVKDTEPVKHGVDRKKLKTKKTKEKKRQRKVKEKKDVTLEVTDDSDKEEPTWLTRGGNSDADYSSDDTNG